MPEIAMAETGSDADADLWGPREDGVSPGVSLGSQRLHLVHPPGGNANACARPFSLCCGSRLYQPSDNPTETTCRERAAKGCDHPVYPCTGLPNPL